MRFRGLGFVTYPTEKQRNKSKYVLFEESKDKSGHMELEIPRTRDSGFKSSILSEKRI